MVMAGSTSQPANLARIDRFYHLIDMSFTLSPEPNRRARQGDNWSPKDAQNGSVKGSGESSRFGAKVAATFGVTSRCPCNELIKIGPS